MHIESRTPDGCRVARVDGAIGEIEGREWVGENECDAEYHVQWAWYCEEHGIMLDGCWRCYPAEPELMSLGDIDAELQTLWDLIDIADGAELARVEKRYSDLLNYRRNRYDGLSQF